MTQSPEKAFDVRDAPDEMAELDRRLTERARRISPRPRWWRRPWMIPLVILVGVFLTYIWGPYIRLDPRTATVHLVQSIPLHYVLVVTHIVTASVAMATACLQVWPLIRRRYPAVHRISGRLFVFAGAVPTSIVAIVLMRIRNDRDGGVQPGSSGLYITAALWLVITLVGYRMGRKHRWAEHRRWMTYSFALSLTNIYSRPIAIYVSSIPGANMNLCFELIGWLPFIVHLGIAQWWLDRTSGLPWGGRRRPRRAVPSQS
ncbi:DUF2306 domain-containing protein [Streptosporangium sp. NPDC020072]|uniref:DUF2306 domain-containing protein n=1 Tax=Streptosporangium sp. NPDC020072 TaxID=3154788 RepID=UPI00342FCB0F